MFDLHTHSFLSDGDLLPSEIARRYEEKGYKAIAITDHVDTSNIKFIVSSILEFCKKWPKNRIKVFPGIELTHTPLEHFKSLISYARNKGIKVILAHGETISEPVIQGTNKVALSCDIDILAHPGLISAQDVELAKKSGIFLEITTRKGHCSTNRHVAKLALQLGAKLIINNDSHSPEDILGLNQLKKITLKSGLNKVDFVTILKDTESFVSNL